MIRRRVGSVVSFFNSCSFLYRVFFPSKTDLLCDIIRWAVVQEAVQQEIIQSNMYQNVCRYHLFPPNGKGVDINMWYNTKSKQKSHEITLFRSDKWYEKELQKVIGDGCELETGTHSFA